MTSQKTMTNPDETGTWVESMSDVTGAATTKAEEWPDYLPALVEDGPKFEGTDVCVENLFTFLDNGWNLYSFLKHFPSVSAGQALAAIRERINTNTIVDSDRDYVSGTPRFIGTRVPIYILFEFLADGENLDEFLDCFPTVSREQAIEALVLSKNALESIAYETATR